MCHINETRESRWSYQSVWYAWYVATDHVIRVAEKQCGVVNEVENNSRAPCNKGITSFS